MHFSQIVIHLPPAKVPTTNSATLVSAVLVSAVLVSAVLVSAVFDLVSAVFLASISHWR